MARLLLICALTVLGLALSVNATVFNVGDSAGWDISSDFPSWVAAKIFYVGDALLFQYSSYHSVNEVDREGYDSCNITNPLLTSSNGNTTVPLTEPGDRYFVCGVQLHCLGGMKLHINVEVNQSSITPGVVGGSPSTPPLQVDRKAPSPLPSDGTRDFPFLTNSASYSHVARGSCGFVVWLCSLGVVVWVFAHRV